MSSLNPFAAFAGHKYLNLETFRKNGGGVRTPVWFAAALPEVPGAAPLYVYTIGNTGKLKRIRNNVRVRIVPCDMRGRLLGEWMEARAEILDGAEAEKGMKLLNRKYAPWKQLLDFFALFRRRNRIVFAIWPA
ncbi:MAG: PPOX class F420-dependent oxidoreductase [Acidobacteria bacterium]|nr:MAG: PPOX class F420-dependent oxidoreductase [Acidobacteriota bacterium]